jgi:hypothetical protein
MSWASPLQPSEGGYGREVLGWTWLPLLGNGFYDLDFKLEK